MSNLSGKHLLVELYECASPQLDDAESLVALAKEAASAMGATVVAAHSHQYEPYGVSVVLMLAESHLSLHTWPEHGTASLDVYVCGEDNDPHRARELVTQRLGAGRFSDLLVERGRLELAADREWRTVSIEQAPASRAGS